MNLLPFDHNKYTEVYGQDIIDHELGVYINNETNKTFIVHKDNVHLLDNYIYEFKGLAIPNDFYNKAQAAREHYIQVKDDCDSIRSSDDQYEDPSEWYAYDEYVKYFKEGNWSNLFWDYCL